MFGSIRYSPRAVGGGLKYLASPEDGQSDILVKHTYFLLKWICVEFLISITPCWTILGSFSLFEAKIISLYNGVVKPVRCCEDCVA